MKTMETYCFSRGKSAANTNSSVKKIKQNILMFLSNYAVCGEKKFVSTLIKNQETSGLLSKLGIRTSLSKIPLIGDIFF